MFDWLHGRAPQLLCARDLDSWAGGATSAGDQVAVLGISSHGSLLQLSGQGPTAAVPLELGGLLFVSSLRCASEESLSAHLDLLPVSGWTPVDEQFVAESTDFALFDGALPGGELAKHRARWILVNLEEGTYDVETYARWQPDSATELHLVRLIRGPSRQRHEG